jgi:hypothetical protein
MPKMYIANCTNQVQDFMYSLVKGGKTMKQIIPIGGQIQIPGDLTTAQIEMVVAQHSKYGMVRVDEIDRARAFVGVCYSIDRRIDVNRVRYALEHNHEVLIERGRVIREEAAVSVNNALQEESRDFRALEMEIKEVPKDGQNIEVEEQKIRVDKTANPDTPKTTGRGGRRKAA